MPKLKKQEMLSDEELCRLSSEGNQEAAEILIRRYKETALRKSRTCFLAGADREDALQECMIGIFDAIRGYDPKAGASFRTFAGLCMDRAMVSAVRRATRLKNRALNESISLDTPISDSEEDGESRTLIDILDGGSNAEEADEDLAEKLNRLLTNGEHPLLSPLEQQVWERFRNGESYREIAEELGKKPKSIDNAIQRIRRKILDLIKKSGGIS
ncbi:MAG: sigma-70 family RNA polymerase sigma factor, partial [Eubacteriales bacterium]|nr:sigma-70 family RNA polymerase sigma factor [Eubacteriales bacterium]